MNNEQENNTNIESISSDLSTTIYHCFYKSINTKTGQYYCGKHSTTNLSDDYFGSGSFITSAIKKYGLSSFTKEIVKIFDTEDEAFQYEAEKIQLSNCYPHDKMSYNLRPGGKGGFTIEKEKHPFYHKHHSKESNEKNRLAHLRKTPWNKGKTNCYSDDTRKRISESQIGRVPWNKGIPCKEETKEKIRIANTGRKITEEQRVKLCGRTAWNKGIPCREETKEKLRQKCTGRKHTPEELEKQSKALKGHIVAKETREKISKGHKGRIIIYNPDTEKMTSVFKEQLNEYLNNGWKIGKSPSLKEKLKEKTKGKNNPAYGGRWMYHPTTNDKKFVKGNLIQDFLAKGYVFGNPRSYNTIWIHNIETKEIRQITDKAGSFVIPNGWKRGKK